MSTTDATAIVDERLSTLLSEFDPTTTDEVTFRGRQYDLGLGWVHFPVGRGGLGLTPTLQKEIDRRLHEAGAKAIEARFFFGITMAGPTIATHGTDEQFDTLLRRTFTGEDAWCQLFSEPGAGSDLAGLGCRAVRDGDEWVISGQKVWNTLAHIANRGMLVARTDPNTPKHKGLTYFALDMHAPGVEVRPLRQMTGEAEFNEVYLTEVRVPDSDRIGEVGEGWRVSMTTLANERTTIGGGGGGTPQQGSGAIAEALRVWADNESAHNAVTRDRLMQLWIRAEVLRLTNIRASQNRRIGNPGPEGSIAKLQFAEVNRDVYEFCVELLGPKALIDYDYTMKRSDHIGLIGPPGSGRKMFLRSRANSIEGGTSEIQRNILGERVLGLPGEPRVDKELPWIEVPRN
jgi:alkylation response protein AidB-like acyl-CoA dehydrogenase